MVMAADSSMCCSNDARQADGLLSNLGHHRIVSALKRGQVGLQVVEVGQTAHESRQLVVGLRLGQLLQVADDSLHGLALLLLVFLQLTVGLLKRLDSLLKSLVGGLRLVLLFVHLVEGQQCLLIAFAHIVEILLQCAIVLEQLLLFVDATLIVFE